MGKLSAVCKKTAIRRLAPKQMWTAVQALNVFRPTAYHNCHRTRQGAMAEVGDIWRDRDETWKDGWKKAERAGYFIARVIVTWEPV
jgi:hypothetical protein